MKGYTQIYCCVIWMLRNRGWIFKKHNGKYPWSCLQETGLNFSASGYCRPCPSHWGRWRGQPTENTTQTGHCSWREFHWPWWHTKGSIHIYTIYWAKTEKGLSNQKPAVSCCFTYFFLIFIIYFVIFVLQLFLIDLIL